MEKQKTYPSDEISPKKKSKLTTIILIAVVGFAFIASAYVTLDILNIDLTNQSIGRTASSNDTVTVDSQVDNVSLSIKDQSALLEYAKNLGVINEETTKLHIVLTPEEQDHDIFGHPDGSIIQSSSHTSENGTLTILVYLDHEHAINTMDEETLADRLLHASMLRMLKIQKNEDDVTEDEISSKIIPYIEGNNEIISIEK